MEKAAENILYQALHLKSEAINTLSSFTSSYIPDIKIPLSVWITLLVLFTLHFLRQVYCYYKFLTSDAMSMLREHLKFTRDILPSFIVSVLTGVRTMNITFLSDNIAANAGLRKLHHHPCRSNYHTFYTDVHNYKANFVIAINTDDRVLAFRQVMMKWIGDRLTSGLLQKTVAEGVLNWIETKESIDMIDITMFLERVVMRFLYDIDPEEVYTPEQRNQRAKILFEGTRWVLYDSYRTMGSLYGVIYHNTGIDLDPIRRPVLKALTEIWDDVYDKQMEMIKKGKKCLLGEFMKDPIVGKLDKDFFKANTIGAIMGGQFLTSISNITGMLYNISNGQKPSRSNKTNWLLQLVSDWSPLISVLRTYEGFVLSIPSTGNAYELHRSFSLGQRQCPGKGMVLRAYGTLVSLLSKYQISVEGLENTTIRSSLWPFANPNLRFRLGKQQPDQGKSTGKKLRMMRTVTFKRTATLAMPESPKKPENQEKIEKVQKAENQIVRRKIGRTKTLGV